MAIIERGGVASVYIGGTLIEVGASIEVKAGGLVRTAKVSSNGVAGYTTKWEAPEVTLEAIDGAAVSIASLKAVAGQTMQVRANNGKTYVLVQAFQVDDPSAKLDEGNITGLKFSGLRCNER